MAETETLTFHDTDLNERQYVLLKDVVIPAGTVLSCAPSQRGGAEAVEAVVAMGKDAIAWFHMRLGDIRDAPADLIAELRPERG